jgi:hypothetical protein
MLKLLLGNPYVLIGIGAALLLSIGSAVWFRHEMVVAREAQAIAETRAGMWEGQATAAIAELKHVRSQLDSLDAKAREQQAASDRAVSDLARQRDAALSEAESFRADLMRKAQEPGATAVSVGRAALDGLRK